MIRKLLARIFRYTRTGPGISASRKLIRRIAIEPLESRRLLAVTGSLSGFAYLANGSGFGGLTVQLESVNSQGGLSNVSVEQTLADGSYSFSGLAAGTYQIQISPSPKLAVGTPSPGSAGGTAGNDEIQVTLAAGQNATDYNFAILGAQTDQISLRMFLASTGPLSQFLTSLHSPPTVATGDSGSTSTYSSGAMALAIAPSATIAAPDSATLTSMTVTIENPADGSSEKLSADPTSMGTLTSNYANGVLTVTGVADVAAYQTMLDSVAYSDSASTATGGDRTISITVNDGTATSAAVTVPISILQGANAATTVTANPTNQTVVVGGTTTFTAAASGSPTPAVQWEVNTGNGYTALTDTGVYSGTSTDTLTITGATSAMSGYQYEAVFTNAAGNATTTAASLTVQTVPTVTTSPTSQTIIQGTTVDFTAAASGNPTPTVQWEINAGSGFAPLTNGGDYSGSTTDTLKIVGPTSTMSGYQYEAVFTNAAGNATTTAATLTVQVVPSVTTEPTEQTVLAGATATFTAAASGTPTPTVQWEVNSGSGFTGLTNTGVYSGSTTDTLTITAATQTMSGYQYEAIFTNTGGSATTSAATLTVQTAPSVTTNPTNQTVATGGTTTFTAAASGNPTPTVQWEVSTGSGFTELTDTGVYSGSGSDTLTITAATQTMNGYQYEAVFTNAAGKATTTAATLTVQSSSALTVTTNPTSQTILAGATATFTAAASGTPTATVQWQVETGSGYTNVTDGGVYSGSATDTLTITAATATMNGYQYEAVFTNTTGNTTSTAATLTVQAPPTVTTSPANQTVSVGDTVNFLAAASGNPTPTVQWEVSAGGAAFTPISGATSVTYSLTASSAVSGNQYEAVFTNGIGTPATTAAATLTVEAANGLTVIAPPPDLAIGSPVLVGLNSTNSGTADFSVSTSDSSELTATLMPQTNRVLKVVTNLGEMDFQLLNNYTPNTVSHFVNLVDSGTYTNTTFYRIIAGFMSQGGVGSSYSGTPISTIPLELNSDLRFTSTGLLAMANNGADGNGSEFFITDPSIGDVAQTDGSTSYADMGNGFLDFRYTIFGKLIAGDSVRQAIAATPVTTTSSGEDSQPMTAPKIESMSVTTETNAGVLMLTAQPGATGSYTVTVADGLGGIQTFTVNITANSYDPPNPWVEPINGTDQITTAANTAVTFTPQGESADGTAVQVNVQAFRPVTSSGYEGDYVDNSYTGTNPVADASNPDVTVTQNGSSFTVTPASGFYGAEALEVTAQSATAAPWDSSAGIDPVYRAYVPVFVAPPAPQIGSISAGGQTVSGSTSDNNSSTATELSFNITGAIAGATVSVYVNGVTTPIATGTVATGSTTITVTTDGTTTIASGSREFTVTQTVPTSAMSLFADFQTDSSGSPYPYAQFVIPASSVDSAPSAGTALTIGLTG